MGFLDEVLDKVGEQWQGSQGFEVGTHKVLIGSAEGIRDAKDRSIIKIKVFNPENESQIAESTLWFHTEGGAKIAVAKILGILVHNQNTEEKKEAVRTKGKKLFGSIQTPEKAQEVALTLLNEKLIGKEAFLVVTIDNEKYATSNYGDLWHYEREERSDEEIDLAADKKSNVDTSKAPGIDPDDVPDFD